jgi:hypothetical protein
MFSGRSYGARFVQFGKCHNEVAPMVLTLTIRHEAGWRASAEMKEMKC